MRTASLEQVVHRSSQATRVALLLSPLPVDGYPPVQHQARLLANSGYFVELVTAPRQPGAREIRFSHPGVSSTVLPLRTGRGLQTIVRLAEFVAALTRVRARHRRASVVEIAYDPLAMFISDLAGLRPAHRVAHFHESLDDLDTLWLQKRLVRAIRDYQIVSVADHTRGEFLEDQLNLAAPPLVVPNYPMRLDDHHVLCRQDKVDGFELVYAGSIGRDQKLDVVIEAVRHCAPTVTLTLIGDRELPLAKELGARAAALGISQRIRFPGWLDYADIPRRLVRAHLGVSLLDPEIGNWRSSLGASNKRYEYMRAGLPQIADMNPGVPELIEGNGVGRCVSSFSPDELAGLISAYVADPARCASEGRRAWQLHRERFNYQNAFAPMIDRLGALDGRQVH